MEEMDKRESYFKKAKFWNIFLIVFKVLGSIAGVISLPGAINPTKQVEQFKQSIAVIDNEEFTATIQKSIDLALSPFNRAYIVITFLISIALVVLLIMANKKLTNQEAPTKIPYFLYLGVIVVGLIVSFLTGGLSFSSSLTMFASLFGISIQILLALPAVLVLINLFKLESN